MDPHFFQYGGLWVYPVGAMLKLASMVGIVTLKSDLAYYLDSYWLKQPTVGGAHDGLGKGQAAMAGAGLVGRITEIGAWSARVLLITDLNSE